jgi:hypothetical protein
LNAPTVSNPAGTFAARSAISADPRWTDAFIVGKPCDVPAEVPVVPVNLRRADAIVLFDWLMTVDLDSVPIAHPAEKQALMDLLIRLEQTDITSVTLDEIDAARAEVARDMGW